MLKKTYKETIFLGNKAIVDFYYRLNDSEEKKVIKSFVRNYGKLIEFFRVSPPKIYVHFIYTRKEMDKYWGKRSEKWLCGMVDPKSIYNIYIFSPLVFEKLTIHSKDEIIPTLIHETAHTFVSQINKKCFAWVNEGVCQFVEKKEPKIKRIKNKNWLWFKNNEILIDPNVSWLEVIKHQGYLISYKLIKHIHKKYGREAIIKLLRIRRDSEDKNLKEKISRILGCDLDKFLADFEKF